MIIIGILVSIILFSLIVLIHEMGHFYAARFFGVKVEEFGLGIPPRARKLFKDKKGTLFSLNRLPIGGFVKLYGENPESLKDKKDKKAFFNKPAWQQSIIILAGVFMNFLLASIIFSILFFTGIKPIGINTKIETNLPLKLIPNYEQALKSGLLIKEKGLILSPVEGSIAEKAGINEGDLLLSINGIEVSTPKKMIEIVSNNAGKEIKLTLNIASFSGQSEKIKERGISVGNDGKIGSYISPNITINSDFEYNFGPIDSIKYGFYETYNQSLLTIKGLGLLVKNIINPETQEIRTEAISQVRGPIGIVDFISDSLKGGIVFLIIIGAVISINLGVFNLMPIPALDGGRFLFITINSIIKKIFGKKAISENTENLIHVGFFIFLIALSLLIAYNDINTIFFR